MKSRRPTRPFREPKRTVPGPAKLVQIEKPIYGGSFLTHDDGKAIFVPMVLPGEQVRVEIVEDNGKRGYAKAELNELITHSPDRVSHRCLHFGPCGGCHYQHALYEAQLHIKQQVLRETLERGGVKPPDEIAVLAGEPWQYRNRIRVAFDAAGNPGYRGRKSHAIVPIRECPIAAPVLVDAAMGAAEFFKGFAPARRPRELSLFCDGTGESMLATAFADASARPPLENSFDALLQQIPKLNGVELVEEREGRPSRIVAHAGTDSLMYRAGGFDYRVDHGVFFQVNRWLVDSLIERATAHREGKLAWDLFAGVGLFARQLAAHFDRVIAVESAPSAAAALAANLAGSEGEPISMPALDFLRGNASGQHPDLVIVDPPRAGIGEEMAALLGRVAAPALVCVSCDPATLARDLRGLLALGYAIDSVTLIDLFPQTFHLESVVHLRHA